jgi:hypothetical protein
VCSRTRDPPLSREEKQRESFLFAKRNKAEAKLFSFSRTFFFPGRSGGAFPPKKRARDSRPGLTKTVRGPRSEVSVWGEGGGGGRNKTRNHDLEIDSFEKHNTTGHKTKQRRSAQRISKGRTKIAGASTAGVEATLVSPAVATPAVVGVPVVVGAPVVDTTVLVVAGGVIGQV